MKSDRRTLVVLAVLCGFLLFSYQFRSYFLFGARLLTGRVTLNGSFMVSAGGDATDPSSLVNWSVRPPAESGSGRDERLGLIIVNFLGARAKENHLGKTIVEIANPLEIFCQENSGDLAAKAHLLRLAITGSSPIGKQNEDYSALIEQAKRLLKVANECAAKEPNNWYWRDRQFHQLILLGDEDEGVKAYIAKPLPSTYNDYVWDEINCKEALYNSQYLDLPESAKFNFWGETLFPHFTTFQQIERLTKSRSESLQIRVAEMEFGRSLVHAGKFSIQALIGIRDIRHGLWKSSKVGPGFKDKQNLVEQEKVQKEFQKTQSQQAWQESLKIAQEDVMPRYLHLDQDLTSLYFGQYGNIFVAAGILCAILSIASILFAKVSGKIVELGTWGWLLLLAALTISGSTWAGWRNLSNGSLGNNILIVPMIGLLIFALYQTKRHDLEKKPYLVVLLIIALLVGATTAYWQASSVIFLLIFVLQRGNPNLSPWTIAIGLALVCYHACLNLAFGLNIESILAGIVIAAAGLFFTGTRKLDPDQPRLASLSVGLVSILIGTYLVAKYDKSIVANLQREIRVNNEIKEHLAHL